MLQPETSQTTEFNSQPNRFTLADCQSSTQVVFFPQALGPLGVSEPPGTPQLAYYGPEGQLTFRGDDIIQQETSLSSLVTVTLRHNADAGELNFTLVLPPVILGEQKQQNFETVAIKTKSRGRVINPFGSQLTYEVLPLSGTAEIIPIL